MIKQFDLTHRWDQNSYYQSGTGNNSNEKLLYLSQSSRTGASLLDTVKYHIQNTRWGGSYPSAEVQLTYFSHSRLDKPSTKYKRKTLNYIFLGIFFLRNKNFNNSPLPQNICKCEMSFDTHGLCGIFWLQ